MKLIVEADGGSRGNPGVAAFGALVRQAPTGRVLAERAAYLGDSVTNNVAEYSGLIAGLGAAIEIDPDARLEVRMDSKLVVSQMSGVWKVKNADLAKLVAEARALIGDRKVTFTWVPRDRNRAADALANEAMDSRGTVKRDPGTEEAADRAPAPVGAHGIDARTPSHGRGARTPPVGAEARTRPAGAAPRTPPASTDAVTATDGTGVGPDLERTASSMSMSDAVRIAQTTTSGTQRHPGAPGPITTIVLVRHGMSIDTDRDVFAGGVVPGPPLSEAGRLQAQAAAAELGRMLQVPWFGLERPDLLLSSPARRALETAQALGEALGLTPHIDEGFIEQDFGLWDGLTKTQVDARWPNGVEEWAADTRYVPEGGESREQVGRRIKDALERVARANLGKTVLVASHAMAVRAAIGAALGAPAEAWFGFRVAPASINVLRLWDLGYTEVVCTNRTVAM